MRSFCLSRIAAGSSIAKTSRARRANAGRIGRGNSWAAGAARPPRKTTPGRLEPPIYLAASFSSEATACALESQRRGGSGGGASEVHAAGVVLSERRRLE